MIIKDLVRSMLNDIASKRLRFQYVNSLLSGLPGEFGLEFRSYIITKYFKSVGKGVKIYHGAQFNGVHEIVVGNDVFIGINNFFQASGGLTIGDHCRFGPDVKIWTINHRFDAPDQLIKEQDYEYHPVIIGRDVWLTSNIFIMPGVQIPDGCIIAAGSVVGVKNYPPYSIIAGNPARVIGNRKPQENHQAGKTVI